jgi:transposase InsO family protein
MPIHTHDAITARRSITAAIFSGSSHPKNAVQTKQDTQFASGSIPSGTVAMTQRILSALANENTIAPSINVITRHSIAIRFSFRFTDLLRKKYTRSFSGMVYAAKRMGLTEQKKPPKKSREQRRYPELLEPGEKVQIDVKEVPYNCLRGKTLRDGKHLYQWTTIDECTRMRFVYGFEEHTPENTVRFLAMVIKAFPFKIKTIQTDNGTEFTYKFISDERISPFDKVLNKLGIKHKLIPPRTPWHNGKVERSHRNDQRYFYDWETFRSVEELNEKLEKHLIWSNNKTMRTLGRKSPIQLLAEKLAT